MLFKKIYPNRIWEITPSEKTIYLTFDDGPHPSITPLVLAELRKYKANATFFCIGKNVMEHPDVYNAIISQGHAVGNHTQNHLDGFKTPEDIYLKDVAEAGQQISTNLFRPPYGRLRHAQANKLRMRPFDLNIIMWSVLSGDFDRGLNKEKCLKNVLDNSDAGSIIVFHDSEKAAEKMLFTLPKTLEFFAGKGYNFRGLKVGSP